MTSRYLSSGLSSSKWYDAIVVASGHYAVPHIPDIKGIRQWNEGYPGRISHSKLYRRPEDYAGKKTIVIGNAASGLDVSAQISRVCSKPLIVSQRSVSSLSNGDIPSDKVIMPEIAEFIGPASGAPDRAVRFTDGHVVGNVDAILFCTGYYHSYPFLSSVEPPLVTSGDRVNHLYQHIFYIPGPTLAFVGVPSKILPFRTCEGQAAVIARTWSGRISLPLEDEMNKWEYARIAERGNGRRFHEMRTLEDLDYHNALLDWAARAEPVADDKIPKRWSKADYWVRERFPAIKRAFAERGDGRKEVRTLEKLGFHYPESGAEAGNESNGIDKLPLDGFT